MAHVQLTQVEAEFSLRQVLMPKLSYPLIATNFTEVQCQEIMKQALTSALPAMGINRHFPRVVAYGPCSHQGQPGHTNLFMEQLIAHIGTLLCFDHNRMIPQDTFYTLWQKISDWKPD